MHIILLKLRHRLSYTQKVETPYGKFLGASFEGIVSRDFDWLQMILINRTWVPDVPLEVFFCFHLVFLVQSFGRVKLLLMHLHCSGDPGGTTPP